MTHLEPTASGDAFDGPAVDGPFVEVAPGTWARAAAVLAVETYTDHAWRERERPQDRFRRREYLTSVIVAGARGDTPAWWRSPFSLEQLRTACRLAEYHEERRRLEIVARLAALHARSDDDGR